MCFLRYLRVVIIIDDLLIVYRQCRTKQERLKTSQRYSMEQVLINYVNIIYGLFLIVLLAPEYVDFYFFIIIEFLYHLICKYYGTTGISNNCC